MDKIELLIDSWVQQKKTGKIIISQGDDGISIVFNESMKVHPAEIKKIVDLGKNVTINTFKGGIASIQVIEEFKI